MQEEYDKLMELYNSLKRQVRQADPHLYERWKAGGFLIDDDIMSMYPTLGKCVEQLDTGEDEEDEE